MTRSFLLIFMLIVSHLSFSQVIGVDEIDPAQIAQWNTNNQKNYQGSYHFGFSEDESEMIVLIEEDIIIAQIRTGEFGTVNGEMRWITNYSNLTNVRIVGNQFFSDQCTGSFVVFEGNDEPLWALRIDNPWSHSIDDNKYELGPKNEKLENSFPGMYAIASTRLLKDEEMGKYSKADLKIMRNEIFARYGHIFIKGGAMESHFNKQDWYYPMKKDVTGSLTEIEKANVSLIRKWESK